MIAAIYARALIVFVLLGAALATAAPALGGWYRATPRVNPATLEPDLGAPLRTWVMTAYDTAKECEAAKIDELMRLSREWHEAPRPPLRAVIERSMKTALQAQCIATDDPRLREEGK